MIKTTIWFTNVCTLLQTVTIFRYTNEKKVIDDNVKNIPDWKHQSLARSRFSFFKPFLMLICSRINSWKWTILWFCYWQNKLEQLYVAPLRSVTSSETFSLYSVGQYPMRISFYLVRVHVLTHWVGDIMAAISQTRFSNAFSWMKIIIFH